MTPSQSGYYWRGLVNSKGQSIGTWCIDWVGVPDHFPLKNWDMKNKLCVDADEEYPVEEMKRLGYVFLGPIQPPNKSSAQVFAEQKKGN